MKAIVIYDSLYGNTEKIARSIAGGLGEDIPAVKIDEAKPGELSHYDIIFAGSPTQGGRHTKPMQAFLDKIPAGALKNVKAAAFDTRLKSKLVKIFGYAASRIGDDLQEKGADLIAPPEPFWVKAAKGPLLEGEPERAAAWAKSVAEKIK